MNYDIPETKEMAILIPYFNFTNSVNIRNNLLNVINTLKKSEIPFFIGEVFFENQKPLFNNEKNVFSFKTNSYMFYKENILNILESKLDDSFKYICIMDADIIFSNTNWYEQIIKVLLKYDICQPFDKAVWFNKDKNIIKTKDSILNDTKTGHPGFVWAFKRDWIQKYRIFDLCLIGGGDRVLSDIILKKIPRKEYIATCARIYQQKIKTDIKSSFIKQTVYHLYHGSMENRQYFERENIILKFLKQHSSNFDISQLITINDDGLYEWKEIIRKEINIKIFEYFKNRKDDE